MVGQKTQLRGYVSPFPSSRNGRSFSIRGLAAQPLLTGSPRARLVVALYRPGYTGLSIRAGVYAWRKTAVDQNTAQASSKSQGRLRPKVEPTKSVTSQLLINRVTGDVPFGDLICPVSPLTKDLPAQYQEGYRRGCGGGRCVYAFHTK